MIPRHLQYLGYRLLRRSPRFQRFIAHFSQLALESYLIQDFITQPYGAAYGLTAADRARLVEQFRHIVTRVPSGTPALVQTILARELLTLPPDTLGDVIECGVWKGATSASLSLVCEMTGRRLIVADSFAGLPGTNPYLYRVDHMQSYDYLEPGRFRGTLDEVRANIRDYGALAVCSFLGGWFADTLPTLDRPLVFAFLDADLESSTRDCLRAIWPLLAEGGLIYTDDAGNMAVVRIFFDEPWWQTHCGEPAPGFIGSGSGLPIMPITSSIGYIRKQRPTALDGWRRTYNHSFLPFQ
ncbi:MAG: hypothetical protein HC876_14900 [Chloroflexaceae bacterium]|nr:hypothetical protein [Chloroflexaceae bacterium]NJO06697.1 hypothetical protein [Chloroflexaceae bacterium]